MPKYTDKYREECIDILCNMYSPSSRTLFVKHMPTNNDDESGSDFEEYFNLIQTLLAMRGKDSDLLERRELSESLKEQMDKYKLPESILRNLSARKSNDALNSI